MEDGDKTSIWDVLLIALWANVELASIIALWLGGGPFPAILKIIIWVILWIRIKNANDD